MKNEKSLYSLFKEIIREHFIRREKLLGDVNLYRGQAPILFLLGEKDGLTQREIVEEIKIKPSTVTLILKRMEKRGLILKKKDEKDRRYSRIYLTDSGRKILCNLKKVFDKLEEECFSGFSDKEKEILRNFFIRIRDNLRSINKGEKI